MIDFKKEVTFFTPAAITPKNVESSDNKKKTRMEVLNHKITMFMRNLFKAKENYSDITGISTSREGQVKVEKKVDTSFENFSIKKKKSKKVRKELQAYSLMKGIGERELSNEKSKTKGVDPGSIGEMKASKEKITKWKDKEHLKFEKRFEYFKKNPIKLFPENVDIQMEIDKLENDDPKKAVYQKIQNKEEITKEGYILLIDESTINNAQHNDPVGSLKYKGRVFRKLKPFIEGPKAKVKRTTQQISGAPTFRKKVAVAVKSAFPEDVKQSNRGYLTELLGNDAFKMLSNCLKLENLSTLIEIEDIKNETYFKLEDLTFMATEKEIKDCYGEDVLQLIKEKGFKCLGKGFGHFGTQKLLGHLDFASKGGNERANIGLDGLAAVGPKGENFSDFDGYIKIYDKSGVAIRGKLEENCIMAEDGEMVPFDEMELNALYILTLLLGDRDRFGSLGANMGFYIEVNPETNEKKARLMLIDPGKVGTEDILNRRDDLRGDLSLVSEKDEDYLTRGIKNLTVCTDTNAADRMLILKILLSEPVKKAFKENIIEAHKESFSKEQNSDLPEELNLSGMIENLEKLLNGRFEYMAEVTKEQRELGHSDLVVLENMMRLTSSTKKEIKGKKDEKSIQLSHLEVVETGRREWQFEKTKDDPPLYNLIWEGGSKKDHEEVSGLIEKFMEKKPNLLSLKGGKGLMLTFREGDYEKFKKSLTEEAVETFKKETVSPASSRPPSLEKTD